VPRAVASERQLQRIHPRKRGLLGMGIFPAADLSLQQLNQIAIAGKKDLEIKHELLQSRERPGREITGHGERSEGHRRADGGCQGRATSRCGASAQPTNTSGRLYSLDSRNQTEGAVAERFNNAASLRKVG